MTARGAKRSGAVLGASNNSRLIRSLGAVGPPRGKSPSRKKFRNSFRVLAGKVLRVEKKNPVVRSRRELVQRRGARDAGPRNQSNRAKRSPPTRDCPLCPLRNLNLLPALSADRRRGTPGASRRELVQRLPAAFRGRAKRSLPTGQVSADRRRGTPGASRREFVQRLPAAAKRSPPTGQESADDRRRGTTPRARSLLVPSKEGASSSPRPRKIWEPRKPGKQEQCPRDFNIYSLLCKKCRRLNI